MTYQEIKSFINTYIVQNGVKSITGAQLNTALNALADYYGFDSVVVTTLPAGSEATANVHGKTLELGIPKGADGVDGRDGSDAVNPFKGWFDADITGEAGSRVTDDTANLPANPVVGDYAYVKTLDISGTAPSQTETPIVKIYECSTAGTWSDSGRTADTSNVQTFASTQQVNQVHILGSGLNDSPDDIPSSKVVSDVLEYESNTETVSERIPYVQNIGYIGNNVITPQTGSVENRYSDPIFLKAGESLKIKGITPTNVGRLASYNPDTQAVTRLLMGESAAVSSASDAYENIYTATEDIYVIVGWNWSYYQLELTKTYQKTTSSSKLDKIDTIDDVLEIDHDSSVVTENLNYTPGSGYYTYQASGNTSFSVNQQYTYTDGGFTLKKGDSLRIVTSNVPTNVSVLAMQDGTKIRGIVGGNGGSQTVEYVAPLDGLYFITFKTADGATITKTYQKNEDYSERLDTLEGQINPMSARMDAIEGDIVDLKDVVFVDDTDTLTIGFVDGYFIGHDGRLSSNSSFGYKEIVVRTGSVITFTAKIHPNAAAISKKIGENSFQELVPCTVFDTATYNYTALETMTIALCFKTDNNRVVNIKNQLVESNTKDIDNILETIEEEGQEALIQDISLGYLFNNLAVIGDSMSVATMDGYNPPLGASWLAFLAKRWNCQNEQWYAMGGTSAHQWLNSTTYGLKKMLDDTNVYNVYFIAYGHNDSDSVGEASDTAATVTIGEGNVPSVPDSLTFCAYYKAIINQIRTKAPHAMIFCLSQYDYSVAPGGWHSQYGGAVIDIAQLYHSNGDNLVYSLETGGVPISDMQIGTHYSTIGYAYIASKVNEKVNKVIYENRAVEEIKNFGVYNL